MNLNIKTTNISLTDAIESYLRKKLEMLSKYVDLDADNVYIQAELGKTTQHHRSGDVFRAEINIRMNGDMIRSAVEKDDLYAAIDEAKDELALILTKQKSKKISLVRRGAQTIKNILRFNRE